MYFTQAPSIDKPKIATDNIIMMGRETNGERERERERETGYKFLCVTLGIYPN